MQPEKISHLERALSRLPYRQDKENMRKLLSIYVSELDNIEDILMSLANLTDVETVTGIWLDYLGKIIGVSRNGRNDEEYREALLLQISINNADGTPDIILDILNRYTGANTLYAENELAFFSILFTGGGNYLDRRVFNLIERIKPAGVDFAIAEDAGHAVFMPAWRSTAASSEVFQTTSDGVTYENFQTTANSGITYDAFFTQDGTTSYEVPEGYSLENAIPAWKYVDTTFQTTQDDGVTYEDFEVNGEDFFTNKVFINTDDVEYDKQIYGQWKIYENSEKAG